MARSVVNNEESNPLYQQQQRDLPDVDPGILAAPAQQPAPELANLPSAQDMQFGEDSIDLAVESQDALISAQRQVDDAVDRSLDFPAVPVGYQLPSVPDFLSEFGGQEPDMLAAFEQARGIDSNNTVYSGSPNILNKLQSTYRGGSVPRLADQFTPMDSSRVDQQFMERDARAQNNTVATGVPLVGVTRSLQDGQPFNPPAERSVIDFFRQTMGVDFTGIDTEREEVRPPGIFDRVVGGAGRAVSGALSGLGLPGVVGALGSAANAVGLRNPFGAGNVRQLAEQLTPGPQESAAARRITTEAARTARDRAARRIERVGAGQFVRENTLGRLGSGTRNLARRLIRQSNPITAFGIGVEDGNIVSNRNAPPTEFVGSGIQLDPESARDPVNTGFFGELMTRSPELRNMMRALEPVVNEAGEVGFNPLDGQFGEFGSAGSLSALLYIANLPEGLIGGTLYELADQVRMRTYNTRVGDLLGNINPLFDEPLPQENRERFDVLGALVGRDYGFTNRYDENRYLALIGNPSLDWLPTGAQISLGFLADMAVGGFSDAFLVDPLFSVGRATRRVASNADNVTGITDETSQTLSRTAQEVLERPRMSGNASNALEELNTALDSVVARSDNLSVARRVDSELDDTFRRLGVGSDSGPVGPVRIAPDSSISVPLRRPQITDNAGQPFNMTRRIDELQQSARIPVPDANIARRVARIDDEVVQLENLIQQQQVIVRQANESVSSSTDEVSAEFLTSAEQTLDSYRRSLQNVQSERATLSAVLSDVSAQLFSDDHVSRAVRLGRVEVTDAGYLLEDVPFALDIPSIRSEAIAPRRTETTADLLYAYRFDPDSVTDFDVYLARRDDITLNSLSNLWGLNTQFELPDNVYSQLANIARREELELRYPDLTAQWGKRLPDSINAPVRRVTNAPANNVTRQRSVSSISGTVNRGLMPSRLPRDLKELPTREVRKQLAKLEESAAKTLRSLQQARYDRNVVAEAVAKGRLAGIKADINQVYAEFPEIMYRDTIEALPDHIRPVPGGQSQQLAAPLVIAQREFFEETSILRNLRSDLTRVDSMVAEQKAIVLRQPRLHRINPSAEFATRRMYGIGERTAVSEAAKPATDIIVPELTDIVTQQGGSVSASYLRRMPELEGLTKAQQDVAISNVLEGRPADRFIPRQVVEEDGIDGMYYFSPRQEPEPPRRMRSAEPATPEATAVNELNQLREQYDNYIPIYEVRDLPSFRNLSREEQDALLFSLQRNDSIDLGTLQDVTLFSDAQRAAGIPQDIGGDLFYIEILDDATPSASAIPEPPPSAAPNGEPAAADAVIDIEATVTETVDEAPTPPAIDEPMTTRNYRSEDFPTQAERQQVAEFVENMRPGAEFTVRDLYGESMQDTYLATYTGNTRPSPEGVGIAETYYEVRKMDGETVFISPLFIREIVSDGPVDVDVVVPPTSAGAFPLPASAKDIFSFVNDLDEGNVVTREFGNVGVSIEPEDNLTIFSIQLRPAERMLDFLNIDEAFQFMNDIMEIAPHRIYTADPMGDYDNYLRFHQKGFRLRKEGVTPLSKSQFNTINTDLMSLEVPPGFGLAGVETPGYEYLYHGTKATRMRGTSYSLSNELGSGYYVTSRKQDALTYSRATPAEDMIDGSDFRPSFTNTGRVYPILVKDNANFVDIRNLEVKDQIRGLFIGHIKNLQANEAMDLEFLGKLRNRFTNWSKKHNVNEYWHYVRSQFLKENQGMSAYADFVERLQDDMVEARIQGLRDGDTVNILDMSAVRIGPPSPDIEATGSIAEGLLARYKADLAAYSRLPDATNKAILENDRLNLDVYIRNQLADAVGRQEKAAIEVTQRFQELENEMERLVQMDTKRVRIQQTDQAAADAARRFNRNNTDEVCL